MNEPTNPNLNSPDNGWNPPAGEFLLDDLFPNPEVPSQGDAPVAQAPPQATEPEYFLKVPTGTVYKTAEEAAQGFAEKDRYIAQQKAELERLKNQNSHTTAPPPQVDFAEQAFDRLAEAVQKGDKRAYIQTLAEINGATLSPLAPLIEEVAQERAIRSLGPNANNFRTFLHSDAYTSTLERLPTLKQAIDNAKVNPAQFANQLPELYALAYNSYVAQNTNSITRDAVTAAQSQAPTPSRPTLAPSTPTPIPTNQSVPVSYTREQLLANRSARQEWLKNFRESRGSSLDVEFGKVGL